MSPSAVPPSPPATEAGARPVYVDALAGARAQDTVYTEAFPAGWPNAPHRVLRWEFATLSVVGGE